MAKPDNIPPVVLEWDNLWLDPSSPMNILICEYPESSDLWHLHKDFCELVIVLAGNACSETDNDKHDVHAGDVFFLPAGSLHRYNKIRSFRNYNLLFKPEVLNICPSGFSRLPNFDKLFGGNSATLPVLHFDDKDLSRAVENIELIRQEYLTRSPGWHSAVHIEFFRTLLFILRYAVVCSNDSQQHTFSIGKTLRYMENEPQKPHTVASLSKLAQMSPGSYRHHFKTAMGMPPIEWLIRLRLKKAVLLLVHTDFPVSQIALDTGFADGSYFARQFQRFFQKTARQFRQEVRAGKLNVTQELEKLSECS